MEQYDSLQYADYLDFLNRGTGQTGQGSLLPEATSIPQGLDGFGQTEGAAPGGGAPPVQGVDMPGSNPLGTAAKGAGMLKDLYDNYIKGGGNQAAQGSVFDMGIPEFSLSVGGQGGTYNPFTGASGQGGYSLFGGDSGGLDPSRYSLNFDTQFGQGFDALSEMGTGAGYSLGAGGLDTSWLDQLGSTFSSDPSMLGGAAELASMAEAGLSPGMDAAGSGFGSLGDVTGVLGILKGVYDVTQSDPHTSAGGNAMMGLASSLMTVLPMMAGMGWNPIGLGMMAFKMAIDLAQAGDKKAEAERQMNRAKMGNQLDTELTSGWSGLDESGLMGRLNQTIPTGPVRTGDILMDFINASNYAQPQWGDNTYGFMERYGIGPGQDKDLAGQVLRQMGFAGSNGADYGEYANFPGETNNLMEYLNYSGLAQAPEQYQDVTDGSNQNYRYMGTQDPAWFGPMIQALAQAGTQQGLTSTYTPDARLQSMLDQAVTNRQNSAYDQLFRDYQNQYIRDQGEHLPWNWENTMSIPGIPAEYQQYLGKLIAEQRQYQNSMSAP